MNAFAAQHTRRWRRAAAIFLAVIALYLATRPGNTSEAEDGYTYAMAAEQPDLSWRRILVPDHVLYDPAIRAYHAALSWSGVAGRAYGQIVVLDIVVGAAGIALFYLLLAERFAVGEGPALLGAALLAASYGPWRYSVEVEIPAWTNLAALALLYAAFAPRRTAGGALLLGGLAALTIAMHGLNSLLACTAIPAWLLSRHGVRRVVAYGGGAAVALAIIFGGVFLLRGNMTREINRVNELSSMWALGPKAIVGLAQSVVGGNFLFGSPAFTSGMRAAFPEKMLQEEIFMGRSAPAGLFAASMATCIGLGITALWLVGARLRLGRLRSGPAAGPYFALWATVYVLFAVNKNPGSFELWIPALVALWTLVVLYIVHPLWTAQRRGPCLAFAALLLLHNLVGGFAWIRDPGSDLNRVRAAWLVDHARDGDLILTADTTELSSYLRYWSHGVIVNTHKLPAEPLGALASTVDRWPSPVYVMDAVFDPPPCLCLLREGFCEQLATVADAIRPLVAPVISAPDVTVYARRHSSTSPP